MIRPYHHACVERLGKARPRIAYVGAAANDSPVFAAMVQAMVFGPQARVVNLKLSRRKVSTTTIRAELADVDLVFFTGGDVARAMELIDERALGPYLRQLATEGKPMEGISAGAILLGRHWVRFPGDDDARAEPFPCLGIVPASFDTHAERDEWHELRVLARLLAASDEREVFGIPSGACARWDGARLTALGKPLARFRCGAPASRLADLAQEACS
jgi:cyanophycinase-like exopeptidase